MSDSYNQVVSKIKSQFPSVKIIDCVYPDALSVITGEQSIKTDYDGFGFLHRKYRRLGNSIDMALEGLLNDLDEIKYYKVPDVVFIRSVTVDKKAGFASDAVEYSAFSRISFGYAE